MQVRLTATDGTPPPSPGPVPEDRTAPDEPALRHSLPEHHPGREASVPPPASPVTPDSPRPLPVAEEAPARTKQPEAAGLDRTPNTKSTRDESIPSTPVHERDEPALRIRDLPPISKDGPRTADAAEHPRESLAAAGRTGVVVPGVFPNPDSIRNAGPVGRPGTPPVLGDAVRSVLRAGMADPRQPAAALPSDPIPPSRALPGGDRQNGRTGEEHASLDARTEPEPAPVRGTETGPEQGEARVPTPVTVSASDPAAAQPLPQDTDMPIHGIAPATTQVPFTDRIAADHTNRTASAGSGTVQTPVPVSVQIAEAAGALGDGRIEMTLSPEELGQLRLNISTTETSAIVAVSADRIDTLDLIRRHLDDLARDFRALGYQDVSFQLSHGDPGPQRGRTDPGNPQATTDAPEPRAPSAQPVAIYRSAPLSAQDADAGLDLRL